MEVVPVLIIHRGTGLGMVVTVILTVDRDLLTATFHIPLYTQYHPKLRKPAAESEARVNSLGQQQVGQLVRERLQDSLGLQLKTVSCHILATSIMVSHHTEDFIAESLNHLGDQDVSRHTVPLKIDLTAQRKTGWTRELTAVHISVKVLMLQNNGKLRRQLQEDIKEMENKADIGNTLACYCN